MKVKDAYLGLSWLKTEMSYLYWTIVKPASRTPSQAKPIQDEATKPISRNLSVLNFCLALAWLAWLGVLPLNTITLL